MAFFVDKGSPVLVTPSGPTPSGHLLLSDDDHNPFLWSHVGVIIIYNRGNEPAAVVREALGKALVPYYPIAGRIVAKVDGGELGVACTGEGVWFIEGSADCRLEDVDYLSLVPLLIPEEQLLPSPTEGIHEMALPFMMQVTQFKCGGFVLGFKFHHAIFDGKGVGQFIGAISEMARGLTEPTIKPIWCRDVIVNPPSNFPRLTEFPSPVHPSTEGGTKLVFCAFDIPLARIKEQKDWFVKETGQNCTTFEVTVAKLWQSRIRAIDVKPYPIVVCIFPANIRHLHEELPSDGGYYGNCVFNIVVVAPGAQIANAPLFDIIKLVKEAKERLPSNYSKSLKSLDQPPPPVLSYGVLMLSDWRQLGLHETDFGWGMPNHVHPLGEYEGSNGVAGILKSPAPVKGIRLTSICVVEDHLEAFINEMNNWS